MNNLKDFANDTVIKDLALECKQYRELIPRLFDDLAAVKKAHKEALEFNYDLAEENTAIHTKVLAMQQRIAALEAKELGFFASLAHMEAEAERLRNRNAELEEGQKIHIGISNGLATDCERYVARIATLGSSELFYRRRCNELQEIQSRMRDPERQMVCDILANGLPRDKAGIGSYLKE